MKGLFKDIWKRSEDGNHREQRSFIRYAIVATVILILFMFLKRDNFVKWIQAGIAIRQQESRIEMLQSEIKRLEEENRKLQEDKEHLEKYARETFYFAAPGDDVYLTEDK